MRNFTAPRDHGQRTGNFSAVDIFVLDKPIERFKPRT
jgi:hypothetical protein